MDEMAWDRPLHRQMLIGNDIGWRIDKADNVDGALFCHREIREGGPMLVRKNAIINVKTGMTYGEHFSYILMHLDLEPFNRQSIAEHAGYYKCIIHETPEWLMARLDEMISQQPDQQTYFQDLASMQPCRLRPQVIVSVKSGKGHAERYVKEVIEPFMMDVFDKQPNHDVHFTTSDQSIIELARNRILPSAQKGEEQLIVLVSGDGGATDILNVLVERPHTPQYRPPHLAIMPLGTGNALANSSSVRGDLTLGLNSLYNGRPRPLSAFKASFSPGARLLADEARKEEELSITDGKATMYGAVVCSWGFHASLVADSDTTEFRKHGADRFQMAAKEALYPADGAGPHAYQGTVSVLHAGEKEWSALSEHEHGYVLATFMSQLEAGFTISPQSYPLNGKLRLIRFGALKGDEIMGLMQKAYGGGTHVDDERVSYQEIDGLRIDFHEDETRWRRVCIDGRIIRVEKDGFVEITTVAETALNLLSYM